MVRACTPGDRPQAKTTHLVLCGGRRLVLGVEAGMDDAIHVEVQVVKLHAVWVGLRRVHRDLHISDGLHLLLNAILHHLGVSGDTEGRGQWLEEATA